MEGVHYHRRFEHHLCGGRWLVGAFVGVDVVGEMVWLVSGLIGLIFGCGWRTDGEVLVAKMTAVEAHATAVASYAGSLAALRLIPALVTFSLFTPRVHANSVS